MQAIDRDVFAVAQRMAAPDDMGRKLNPEQQEVATAILTSDSRFLAIQGVAGAGKTFTMRRAFDEAREAGYQILGLAPTNKAAGELRTATGEGQTLASFLASDVEIGPQSIVVLDEGGMVSTKDMHCLMLRVEAAGARLVMVGDTEQLKAVAAGDPFGLLQRAECLRVVELTKSTRAKSDLMLSVYPDLFKADTDSALDKLKPRVVADSNKRYGQIASAYLEIDDTARDQDGLTAQDRTLILVGTNAARMEINARVREGLGLAGHGVKLDTLIAADATEAQLRRIDTYRVGQVIQAGEAIIDGQSLKLQARAGEQFAIVGVDYKAGTLKLAHVGDNGRHFTLPVGRNMPRIMLYDRERIELSAGDRVLMRANDKAAEVYNGDRGRVVAVDHERRAVTIEIGHGESAKVVTISNAGDRLPMLNHGYAMTVHSSQGATVDTVLTDLSADRTTNRNLMLVAATRARQAVLVWSSDAKATRAAVRDAAVKYNATEVLAAHATELAASAATTTQEQSMKIERNTGVILSHGAAPYQHEAKNSQSYYVKLRNDDGREWTIWGVDLLRAMEESQLAIGDRVTVANLGAKSVQVPVKVRDDNGHETGEVEEKTVKRNEWQVTAAPLPRVDEAQHRLQGAYAAPEKAPAPLPDSALALFERRAAVHDGMPVTEYHRSDKLAFYDTGEQVNSAVDIPNKVEMQAMIELARSKWGDDCEINGSEEFKQIAAQVCAANGWSIARPPEFQQQIDSAREQAKQHEKVGQQGLSNPARQDAGAQKAAPNLQEGTQRPSHIMLTDPDGQQTSYMTREGSIMRLDQNGQAHYDAEATIELRTRHPRQYYELVEAAGGVIGLDGKACAWVDGEPRESAESQRIREHLEAEQRTANAVLGGETLAEGRTSDGKTVAIQAHDGHHALVTVDQEGRLERADELTAKEADDILDDLDLEDRNDRIDGDELRSAAHDKIERGNADRSEQDQRPRVTLERNDLRAMEAERSHAIGVATEQPERAQGQVRPQQAEREVAGNDELRAALDAQVEAAQQRAERERENSYSR